MNTSHLFGRSLRFVLTAALLTILLAGESVAQSPRFCWSDAAGGQLLLKERGETVLAFQLAAKSWNGKFPRANYVHPLFDTDGKVVTEDFPKDHRHHRGVFWAWHQLLLNGKPTADPWVCQGIQWEVPEEAGYWLETRAGDSSAGMTVVRDWTVPNPNGSGRSLRLVRATTNITVWASRENLRILDFDLRFRALMPGVSIGGSDDVKGYGGFSPRIRLADDVKFVGQIGSVAPQRLAAVEGGAWMDVVGTLDGKRKGVTIMVHPSHPGYPLKWILRPKGSMQNPQWPGRKPVRLSTTEDLRLRYRLVVHVGELNHEAIESIWQDFAQEKGGPG